jgi:mono/diheme cytochrome c family protein
MRSNSKVTAQVFSILLVFSLAWSGSALADGKSAHDHPGHLDHHDAHMQAMMREKERIPAEFRIMDRTPVTPTATSLTRGKMLYEKHCSVCHGEVGRGDGPAAVGLETRPASFLDLEHSSIYSPGEKYWIIGNGTKETRMPGFGHLLAADERWDLVNHILSLQEKVTGKKHHH